MHQQAAACLRDSALPLEEVAERCGYDSASAFSRAYKRAYGVAPGQWRRLHTGALRADDPER